MHPFAKNMLDRFSRFDSIPALAPARTEMERVFATMEEVRAQHAKIAKNDKLTEVGKRDAMRKFVGEHLAGKLRRAERAVAAMRTKVTEHRAALQPAAPDRNDVAAAVLRSEMRTLLRNLSPGERLQRLTGPNADPTLQAAVLEAPGFMSGTTEADRQMILNAVIERTHPGELARLEEFDEAIEHVNAAFGVALVEIRSTAEFPNERMLQDFVAEAVPDTGRLDAEMNHQFADLAKVA